MSNPEFVVAAARNGALRSGDRLLPSPLVDEVIMRGSLRRRTLPGEVIAKIRDKWVWGAQIYGFRFDGSPLGEFTRHMNGESETRFMIPSAFSRETRITIGRETYSAAVTAGEWVAEVKPGAGAGGRILILLHPFDATLVPFCVDNIRFGVKGQLLLPCREQSESSQVKRVFADREYAGTFYFPRTQLTILNWLFFREGPERPSAILE